MIARLKGIIDAIGTTSIIIDVNGVGYAVFMPANALANLQTGDAVAVEIITVVREDAFMLYGFLTDVDKQWFEILTAVQGVGAKVALAIQSVLSADDLYVAVMAGDNTAFARASGVGAKLASRIVLELKHKEAKLPAHMTVADSPHTHTGANTNNMVNDTVSVLVNLGFARSQAYSAVQSCLKDAGDDINTEQLIKVALSQLQG